MLWVGGLLKFVLGNARHSSVLLAPSLLSSISGGRFLQLLSSRAFLLAQCAAESCLSLEVAEPPDESWQLPRWALPWDSRASGLNCANQVSWMRCSLCSSVVLSCFRSLSMSITTGPGHCIPGDLLREAGIMGISILSLRPRVIWRVEWMLSAPAVGTVWLLFPRPTQKEIKS